MKNDTRAYYTAYEERYKTAHQNGVSWRETGSALSKKVSRAHALILIT